MKEELTPRYPGTIDLDAARKRRQEQKDQEKAATSTATGAVLAPQVFVRSNDDQFDFSAFDNKTEELTEEAALEFAKGLIEAVDAETMSLQSQPPLASGFDDREADAHYAEEIERSRKEFAHASATELVAVIAAYKQNLMAVPFARVITAAERLIAMKK